MPHPRSPGPRRSIHRAHRRPAHRRRGFRQRRRRRQEVQNAALERHRDDLLGRHVRRHGPQRRRQDHPPRHHQPAQDRGQTLRQELLRRRGALQEHGQEVHRVHPAAGLLLRRRHRLGDDPLRRHGQAPARGSDGGETRQGGRGHRAAQPQPVRQYLHGQQADPRRERRGDEAHSRGVRAPLLPAVHVPRRAHQRAGLRDGPRGHRQPPGVAGQARVHVRRHHPPARARRLRRVQPPRPPQPREARVLGRRADSPARVLRRAGLSLPPGLQRRGVPHRHVVHERLGHGRRSRL
mmetsp:Transcript_6298/g.28471  ORF Transcript_6298/g.28471 Transcript_6298/m.28471 type:complete len:293 (+) Transcript_6298:1635-2513(+)